MLRFFFFVGHEKKQYTCIKKKYIWWHCVDAFSKRATLSSGWGWPFTSQDVSQFLHVHYGDSWHLLVVQELNGLLRVCSTGSKIDLAALEVKARLARPMGWLSYDWQEEMKVRSDFLHCGAEGRKVESLFSPLPGGNVWGGLWTKCSPSTRREPIRHRGRGPRPWCSARRWGRWHCPPGWRWSWTRRPPCSRNKMFSKRAWLTAEQIYRLCQRKFECSRRTNSSLICTGGGGKKKKTFSEWWTNCEYCENLRQASGGPRSEARTLVWNVWQEMRKFFKVGSRNVHGTFSVLSTWAGGRGAFASCRGYCLWHKQISQE